MVTCASFCGTLSSFLRPPKAPCLAHLPHTPAPVPAIPAACQLLFLLPVPPPSNPLMSHTFPSLPLHTCASPRSMSSAFPTPTPWVSPPPLPFPSPSHLCQALQHLIVLGLRLARCVGPAHSVALQAEDACSSHTRSPCHYFKCKLLYLGASSAAAAHTVATTKERICICILWCCGIYSRFCWSGCRSSKRCATQQRGSKGRAKRS